MTSKLLDSISRDNENMSSSPKISRALKPIMDRFPNLSHETLEKLSTPEGLRDRHKILQSLSEDELRNDINPFNIEKEDGIKLEDLSIKDQKEVTKIIQETTNLDSLEVINKIKERFPNYDETTYKNSFMKTIEEEMASGKTDDEKRQIALEIRDFDLKELEDIGNLTIKDIKNIVNENYTHNKLFSELRKKANKSLENLDETDQELLEKTIKTLKPDVVLDGIKDFCNNDYTDSLIINNVDFSIQKIIDKYPGASKQVIIEKLLKQNPLHKDEILRLTKKAMDINISSLKSRLSDKDFNKMEKALTKEDIKEMQSLEGDRTIDQIKTLKHVNRSHISLLNEIKNKPSLSSINTDIEKEQSQFSSNHMEDTMNLFN